MDITNFKSGVYKQQYQYKSFLPSKINIPWNLNDRDLIYLLSETDIKLGELNAFSHLIPDIDFFISMHISKEATTSNRIEGTQTNISDVLQKSENIDPNKKNDWQEVQNYIRAMNEAISSLAVLPISSRLLQNTHKILLQGVRGTHKLPGEFRHSQNWIGGTSLSDAVFIPPHYEDLPELLTDLENFINDETQNLPHLIKIGLSHYQFETLHPFLDGNGRVGRLLITLYLVSKNLLSRPTLYLSAFFEKNKDLYYDNLSRVRTHNDLVQWLKFFLEGVKQTAANSIETFKAIILLRQEIEDHTILSLGKKTKLAKDFLHHLYRNPIVESADVSNYLKITSSTASRLIEDFIRLNILKEITGFKRNRIFVFSRYLKLFE